jgi:ATP-dependent Clp protease ATP-binding subunit ClpB
MSIPAFTESKMDESIAKLPKVQGGEPAQNISRDMNNVFLKANAVLKEFKDEFISPEHLLLGLLQVNDDTAKTLKAAGLTEKGLITAIKDLRKGDKYPIPNAGNAVEYPEQICEEPE